MTEMVDLTQADNYKASIGIVHGMAQDSNAFFETAFHFALNGFCVHMVDLEGFGYTSGWRVFGLTIEGFHHQVTTLLQQVRPELPLYLMGHSMGGLTINTYLGCNPAIASRLAGVIYSAPFLGMSETMSVDPLKKFIVSVGANVLGEFVMICPFPIHMICRDRTYMRTLVPARRS